MPWLFKERLGPARARSTEEGVPPGAGTRSEQRLPQGSAADPGAPGDLATDLLLAVCEDDEAGVRGVLDRCPDLLHLRTSQLGLAGKDSTPLHIAASCGHAAVVRLFVKRGARALGRDADGDTPFNCAVLEKRWEVARYLASVGAASAQTQRDQNCLIAYGRHTRELLRTPQPGRETGLTLGQALRNWDELAKRVERHARACTAHLKTELSLGYRGIRRPVPTELAGSESLVVSPRSAAAAGVLGVLLGGLGAHRFYLGFWALGALQTLVTLLTWSLFPLGAIWGAAEGILILFGRLSLDAGGGSLQDPGCSEAVRRGGRRVRGVLGHAGERVGEWVGRVSTTLRSRQRTGAAVGRGPVHLTATPSSASPAIVPAASAAACTGPPVGNALDKRSQDRLSRLPLHAVPKVAARVTTAVALLVLVTSAGLLAWRAWAPGLVSMPRLTGFSKSAALRTAPEELRLQVAGEEHAPEPRGTVLRQEPAPGERVAKGDAVRIWVSLGPARRASSVVGLPPSDARAGGSAGSQGSASSGEAKPGGAAPLGRPRATRVPKVVGLPVTSARKALAEAGLLYTVAGHEFDRSHPEGTVIRQVPPAGLALDAFTRVRVVVSKGWRVRVPRVTGLTQSVAMERLRESGLVVTVASRRDASVPRGLAVRSTPPAGRTVQRGSRVTLVISTGTPPARPPGYGTLSVSAEPAGCQVWVYVDGGGPRGKSPLTIRLAPGGHAVTLWDTNHRPGIQQDSRVEIAAGTTTKLHRRMH